jgi:predicted small metal-binding protein
MAMKKLQCKDLGHACSFEAQGASVEEILQQAGRHAAEHHQLAVTPELVEAVKQKIKDA